MPRSASRKNPEEEENEKLRSVCAARVCACSGERIVDCLEQSSTLRHRANSTRDCIVRRTRLVSPDARAPVCVSLRVRRRRKSWIDDRPKKRARRGAAGASEREPEAAQRANPLKCGRTAACAREQPPQNKKPKVATALAVSSLIFIHKTAEGCADRRRSRARGARASARERARERERRRREPQRNECSAAHMHDESRRERSKERRRKCLSASSLTVAIGEHATIPTDERVTLTSRVNRLRIASARRFLPHLWCHLPPSSALPARLGCGAHSFRVRTRAARSSRKRGDKFPASSLICVCVSSSLLSSLRSPSSLRLLRFRFLCSLSRCR